MALYVKDNLNVYEIPEMDQRRPSQDLWIRLTGEDEKSLDGSKAYDIIYLDFQKAFDKVPHDKLIFKMRSIEIIGRISEWVQNWLQDRTQRVVVGGILSEQGRVGSGVPQGSVLGPLLFLIYINDRDTDIESTIVKVIIPTFLWHNPYLSIDIYGSYVGIAASFRTAIPRNPLTMTRLQNNSSKQKADRCCAVFRLPDRILLPFA